MPMKITGDEARCQCVCVSWHFSFLVAPRILGWPRWPLECTCTSSVRSCPAIAWRGYDGGHSSGKELSFCEAFHLRRIVCVVHVTHPQLAARGHAAAAYAVRLRSVVCGKKVAVTIRYIYVLLLSRTVVGSLPPLPLRPGDLKHTV